MAEGETVRNVAPQRQERGPEAGRGRHRGANPSVGLDAAACAELEAIGYPADALALLDLIPLVEVVWADGSVSIRERDVILEAALRRGFSYGDPAYRQLVAWLAVKPTDALFRASLRALSVAWLSLPLRAQDDFRQRLLDGCRRVAAVSGGICGRGGTMSAAERRALANIAEMLAVANVPNRAA